MLENLSSELKLRGFSPQTVKSYLYHNKKFKEFSGKEDSEIAEVDIKRYLASLLDKNLSHATVALAKAAITFHHQNVLKKKLEKIWIIGQNSFFNFVIP